MRKTALLLKSMELNQSLMSKPRDKTTNWKQYNRALNNRRSLIFWIDEETIAEWTQHKQGKRGKPRRFSDLAITTALMGNAEYGVSCISK